MKKEIDEQEPEAEAFHVSSDEETKPKYYLEPMPKSFLRPSERRGEDDEFKDKVRKRNKKKGKKLKKRSSRHSRSRSRSSSGSDSRSRSRSRSKSKSRNRRDRRRRDSSGGESDPAIVYVHSLPKTKGSKKGDWERKNYFTTKPIKHQNSYLK